MLCITMQVRGVYDSDDLQCMAVDAAVMIQGLSSAVLTCLVRSGAKVDLQSSLMAPSTQALSSSVIILSLKTRWHSWTHSPSMYPSGEVTEPPKGGSSPKGEFFMNLSRDAKITP